jgi:hypothetical protein
VRLLQIRQCPFGVQEFIEVLQEMQMASMKSDSNVRIAVVACEVRVVSTPRVLQFDGIELLVIPDAELRPNALAPATRARFWFDDLDARALPTEIGSGLMQHATSTPLVRRSHLQRRARYRDVYSLNATHIWLGSSHAGNTQRRRRRQTALNV